MSEVPEFPPSDLICTPREWEQAFENGRIAYIKGYFCLGPDGKTNDPWVRGWVRAKEDDNG